MKFAYADPPYVGCGNRYVERQEVDQRELMKQLFNEYPDGWALSCSTPSLPELLSYSQYFVKKVRVGAWVKPFASFKPNVNPAYAWEPVIFCGGRKRGRADLTVRDWVSCSITMQKGMAGAKPEAFAYWIFGLLGMTRDDVLIDLFPGTGAVGAAFLRWQSQHLEADP